MRIELLGLTAFLSLAIGRANAAELRVTKVARPAAIPAALIVGRAVCSESTWLLTDSHQLTEVRNDGQVSVRAVTGLTATDRLWGLACLSDGTLWTMAGLQTLGRIDRTGRLQDRIDLRVDRMTLYAVGDRLLYQPRRPVPGTAALLTSPARRPYAVKTWAGLVVPRGGPPDGSAQVAVCGIAVDALAPCWFGAARQFTISDGTVSRTIDAPLQSMAVDPRTPIRDVALTSATAYWLLAGGRDGERGRTSGVRLVRVRENPSQNLFIDLKPSARIILSASDTRCVLLTVDGGLIEVVVTP
jgi:hypothetical protein